MLDPDAKRRRPKPVSDLVVGGVSIPPGSAVDVELDVARLPTRTRLTLPVRVIRGRREGPVLWISAAIHGDELNGIEIVNEVLQKLSPAKLRGSVIAVPIVNLNGFLTQTRNLPDGRDLNRSFPGSQRGSLASRLANLFMREVVSRCTHGIDFHTATNHRTNLPQIRANLDDAETRACAAAFAAPVTLHAALRDGSLREAASRKGVRVLLFEGGEAQRFDLDVVAAGVRGARRVLAHLGMTDPRKGKVPTGLVSRESRWVRAPRSGLLRSSVKVGEHVQKGQRLGTIANAFGEDSAVVRAPAAGLVIGGTLNPVVHQGDALVHLATIEE